MGYEQIYYRHHWILNILQYEQYIIDITTDINIHLLRHRRFLVGEEVRRSLIEDLSGLSAFAFLPTLPRQMTIYKPCRINWMLMLLKIMCYACVCAKQPRTELPTQSWPLWTCHHRKYSKLSQEMMCRHAPCKAVFGLLSARADYFAVSTELPA